MILRVVGCLVLLLFMSGAPSALQANPAKKKSLTQTTTIVLVRHAEKKKDKSRNPALTTLGKKRALVLRRILRSMPIHTIYSTPLRRTRQTVLPIAKARKLKLQEVLRVKLQVQKLKTQHPGQTVLVSGHSNTIPAMLKMLGVKKTIVIKENDYDDLFIVRWTPNQPTVFLHLHY